MPASPSDRFFDNGFRVAVDIADDPPLAKQV
jgi:hypothetical protein